MNHVKKDISPEQSVFQLLEIHFLHSSPRCAALAALPVQVPGLRSASFFGSLHFLAAGSAHLRAEFRVRLQIFKEISISIEPLLGKQKIT